MRFPSKEIVDGVRKAYSAGTRVELLRMDDFQAPPIGTKGTVTGVDDTGSILVDWDNGSHLNLRMLTDYLNWIRQMQNSFPRNRKCSPSPFLIQKTNSRSLRLCRIRWTKV